MAASLAGLTFYCGQSAVGQSAPQPGQDRPLPEIAPSSPNLDFTIQAPRRSPVPRAVEELTFDVKSVHVRGMNLFSADSLDPLTAPVIGKTVHLADLIAVADAIESRYHQDGYILTRAFVPTQSVNDGAFEIDVVEGYIAAVAVQGGDEDSRQRVEALLSRVTQSRPLKLSVLETALLTANQLPGVSAAGLLRPSPTEPGASELVVTVTEAPVTASLSGDNSGGPNTGRWTIAAEASAHSPLGDGGQVTLDGSVDPADINRRHSISGRYTAPLPFLLDGMTYTLSGLGSHGQPGGSVAQLSLITNSTAFGARVTLPLITSRADKLSIDAGLTVQSADVAYIAPTHDEWRVGDVAVTYQNSDWANGVTNATLDIAQGIPSLGATASRSANLSRPGGETDFIKYTAQIRRTQPIIGRLSAALTLSGQYSPNTLLTGEEVSYGGPSIGRGYDPGSITGDIGAGESAELRYDLDPTLFDLEQAQLYSFFDSAKVWHSATAGRNEIASTGVGGRITAFTIWNVGLEYDSALIAVPGSEKDKRSSRVMLNTSIRY